MWSDSNKDDDDDDEYCCGLMLPLLAVFQQMEHKKNELYTAVELYNCQRMNTRSVVVLALPTVWLNRIVGRPTVLPIWYDDNFDGDRDGKIIVGWEWDMGSGWGWEESTGMEGAQEKRGWGGAGGNFSYC